MIDGNVGGGGGGGGLHDKKIRQEKIERDFENKCLRLLKIGDWNTLDQIAS